MSDGLSHSSREAMLDEFDQELLVAFVGSFGEPCKRALVWALLLLLRALRQVLRVRASRCALAGVHIRGQVAGAHICASPFL